MTSTISDEYTELLLEHRPMVPKNEAEHARMVAVLESIDLSHTKLSPAQRHLSDLLAAAIVTYEDQICSPIEMSPHQFPAKSDGKPQHDPSGSRPLTQHLTHHGKPPLSRHPRHLKEQRPSAFKVLRHRRRRLHSLISSPNLLAILQSTLKLAFPRHLRYPKGSEFLPR